MVFKIGGADRTYHRSRMYEFRLDLFSSASQKSFDGLVGVIANLEEFKDYSWLGLAYLNLGLYHLLRGELQQSLSQTRSALLPFEVVSSWMVSDVHQLLARCHLAMGNLEEAHKEAAEAKARFIRLQLYHRVTETEIIETAIEIAQESKDWQQWREFTILEFEQNFKYVGL